MANKEPAATPSLSPTAFSRWASSARLLFPRACDPSANASSIAADCFLFSQAIRTRHKLRASQDVTSHDVVIARSSPNQVRPQLSKFSSPKLHNCDYSAHLAEYNTVVIEAVEQASLCNSDESPYLMLIHLAVILSLYLPRDTVIMALYL